MEDNFHGFVSKNKKIKKMNIAITGQKITIISVINYLKISP